MAVTPITALHVINRILARLREAEVNAFTDTDYARLLLRLVNDAKREVEDAFNWSVLKRTISLSTVVDEPTVSITDGVNDETTQRSRIVEVYNSTTDTYLMQRPRDAVRRLANSDDTAAEPVCFAFDGFDANQNLRIELHNKPDQVYAFEVTVYVPQEDILTEEEIISAPWYPIYLRALALALRERGDDEGLSTPEAFQEYMVALNDAIAYEQRHMYAGTSDGDWHVISNGF